MYTHVAVEGGSCGSSVMLTDDAKNASPLSLHGSASAGGVTVKSFTVRESELGGAVAEPVNPAAAHACVAPRTERPFMSGMVRQLFGGGGGVDCGGGAGQAARQPNWIGKLASDAMVTCPPTMLEISGARIRKRHETLARTSCPTPRGSSNAGTGTGSSAQFASVARDV